MKRVALWLAQEVGEGNVFTKDSLRAAFPGVAQVDRRARELRKFEWVINTNKEEAALEANEQRLVKKGIPVWEPGKAALKGGGAISAAERRRIFDRDGHMCQSCGVGAGDEYPDGGYSRAQLTIARRKVLLPGGGQQVEAVTECDRCRVGGRNTAADAGAVLERVQNLQGIEREIFLGWIKEGGREMSRIERLWADFRALPPEAREEVARQTNGD